GRRAVRTKTANTPGSWCVSNCRAPRDETNTPPATSATHQKPDPVNQNQGWVSPAHAISPNTPRPTPTPAADPLPLLSKTSQNYLPPAATAESQPAATGQQPLLNRAHPAKPEMPTPQDVDRAHGTPQADQLLAAITRLDPAKVP